MPDTGISTTAKPQLTASVVEFVASTVVETDEQISFLALGVAEGRISRELGLDVITRLFPLDEDAASHLDAQITIMKGIVDEGSARG